MKNQDRKLPPKSTSQQITDKELIFNMETKKLERAFSFHSPIEQQLNLNQGNEDFNKKICVNSQEISCIDNENGSFQDQCDQFTNPLSSIKRANLFDIVSVQESNSKAQNKIKPAVSDFKIHLSEIVKEFVGKLQFQNILNLQSNSLYPTKQVLNVKNQNLKLGLKTLIKSNSNRQQILKKKCWNHQIQNIFFLKQNFRSYLEKQAILFQINTLRYTALCIFYYNQVYNLKLKTVQLKYNETYPSQIIQIDPVVDQQKKRLLEEQMNNESKKNQNQDKLANQRAFEKKFNLDFTKLYQKVDESIIQQYQNNNIQQSFLQSPFIMPNQNSQTTFEIFQNKTALNPFQNSLYNQQGFNQVNPNLFNNSITSVNNQTDQIKTKSYNTRSRMN
ncbi:unnamed protein product [Paramecium sonneborni]|uniref:Uncharacterized protein n=1 Tax=Paramecium sonneborni TaxID=65129 RepID=A0A8S1MT55_9CILI|nr:unnamed protein product [Paramecium sonneborni]